VKIRPHSESHIVELTDRSRWKMFPADIDVTLHWDPDTDLSIELIDDEISSHALVDASGGNRVRVIPADGEWTVREVKKAPKDE
jgi:hypothetical protein